MILIPDKKYVLQLCSLLTLQLPSGANAEKLTLATDHWCPFVCESTSKPGYVAEITKRIFELENYQVNVFKIPFKRALIATQNKDFDAVLLVSKADAEKYNFIRNQQHIAWAGVAFFVKNSSRWKFTSRTSLETIRLGLVNGYSYGEELDYIFKIKHAQKMISWAHGANPIEQNLSKLIKNRVDVILDNREVIEYTAKKMGIRGSIKFAGSDDLYDPLYVGFSNKNANGATLAAIYDKGLSVLRGNGELEKILKAYGLKDWEK